jgi:hypothetical protein
MRFHGAVGYGDTVETAAGVFEDVITEVQYYGDVVRNARLLHQGESLQLNDDISVSNSISIVADAYANDNFMNIRYIEWAGTRWTVTNVSMARPRLVLFLGVVYNGPIPA